MPEDMDALDKQLEVLEKLASGDISHGEAIAQIHQLKKRFLVPSEESYWEEMKELSNLALRVIRLERLIMDDYANQLLKETNPMPLQKHKCDMIGKPVEISNAEDINAFIETARLDHANQPASQVTCHNRFSGSENDMMALADAIDAKARRLATLR